MLTMNGIQFRDGITAAAHKICSALALQSVEINWVAGAATASITSNGNIRLPAVADDAKVTKKIFLRYVGFVIHELLHRKYSTFKQYKDGAYVMRLHNAVEDVWIERQAIRNALLGNVEDSLVTLMQGVVDDALAEGIDWANPAQYPFAVAVTCRNYGMSVPLVNGMQTICDKASTMIDDCKSSDDTMKVARWIFKQLQNIENQPEDQPKEKPKANPEGKDGGKDGTDAGSEPSDKDGKGEGKGKGKNASKGAGKGKAPAESTQSKGVEPKLDTGTANCGNWFNGGYQTRDGSHVGGFDKWDTSTNAASAKLRNEVKRLMDSTAREEFSFGRKTGSLDVRSIHKAPITDKVFGRRTEEEGIDTAVLLLIDVSGSMFGRTDKLKDGACLMSVAAPVAATLIDTFKRAQVAYAVGSFGDCFSVVSPFGANHAGTVGKISRLVGGGATNDYIAIRYCHELLARRSEKRKILFVLTDGIGNMNETRNQIIAAENIGITTIGVGIAINVSHTYPNNIEVKDLSQLGNASFKKIKLAL